MGTLLTTADVPVKDRLSYWCDLICDVFVKLDASQIGESPFCGSINTNQFGFIQFSNVISNGLHVLRSQRQISKSTEDFFLVSFQFAGMGQLIQDGRTACLYPGQWALYDSTRPYDLIFNDDYEQLVLQMPRNKLRSRLMATEMVTAVAMSGDKGLGKVTADFVRSVHREQANVDFLLINRMTETICDLLATCLEEVHLHHSHRSTSHLVNLIKIKAFIHERLANSDLSVETIAKAMNLSARYLHTLFEEEDTTLACFIREARLERCRQALLDQTQFYRSITDIAFSWGFNDAAHFSRLFKHRFGITPRDYRQNALNR
jgi:AraC-like DNA-binding protein